MTQRKIFNVKSVLGTKASTSTT